MEKRKQTRLPEYDYSRSGAYFVTVCSKNKEALFWSVPVGADIIRPKGACAEYRLSEAGQIVEQAIQNIPDIYEGVFVDKYVVMPNHVHMILTISGGRMISAPTVSTIIAGMKRWASRQWGHPLWQKSFYDHIIRDESDFLTKWNYIDTNPVRWQEDEYCEG